MRPRHGRLAMDRPPRPRESDRQMATMQRRAYRLLHGSISGADNPSGAEDQDIYIKALVAAQAIDLIEYGSYVSRVKQAPLATPDKKGRPVLTRSAPPLRSSRTPPTSRSETPSSWFPTLDARRRARTSTWPRISFSMYSRKMSTPPSSFPTTATCAFPSSRPESVCRWGPSIHPAAFWPEIYAGNRRTASEGTGGQHCARLTTERTNFLTPLGHMQSQLAGRRGQERFSLEP